MAGAVRTIELPLVTLPPGLEAIRGEVRAFIERELAAHPPERRAKSWLAFDPAFSRKVAERGWVGMTWPRRYGGGERSALERYVVLEELLAAGAPVAAHWTGDRQSGPMLLRFGTEAQRARFLPLLARGEIFFCIGMSEPDAGSDLAAIRTRARRVDGGWRVTGAKLWTSNAQRSDFMISLVRTEPPGPVKQQGLSQFIVDLKTPGIACRPIDDITGEPHFNEVVFDDAFLPDESLVGRPGDGWQQVTSELAFERSGPERFLSAFPLLVEAWSQAQRAGNAAALAQFGRLLAHLMTLRQMSISVAGLLQSGRDPAIEAALIKDLGMSFEQEVPRVVQAALGAVPTMAARDALSRMLAMVTLLAPSFSLRGGTREIMRGIIARSLGLR
ncbi:MAG: acyl-CoA dehydrogenase family protein [Alphaproteobacteria bacterium]|nr:acyl-CoA dehydrogenase family protein [Alphaproteobacteria bacterium]